MRPICQFGNGVTHMRQVLIGTREWWWSCSFPLGLCDHKNPIIFSTNNDSHVLVPIYILSIEQNNIGVSEVHIHCYFLSIHQALNSSTSIIARMNWRNWNHPNLHILINPSPKASSGFTKTHTLWVSEEIN